MPLKSQRSPSPRAKRRRPPLASRAIDLLLVHAPFGGADGRLSMWKALVQCQEQGLARSIGVCNYDAHLEEIAAAGLGARGEPDRAPPHDAKAELLAYMAEKHIQPVAYSSLALLPSWRQNYPAIKGTITSGERDKAAPVAALATQLDVPTACSFVRAQKGGRPAQVDAGRIKDDFDLDTFSLSDDQMRQLGGLGGCNFAGMPPGQHGDLTTTP